MIEAIRTDRLVLRPIREADRAEFVRVHETSHDDHFAAWVPAPDPDRTWEALFDAALARATDEAASGTGVRWVGAEPDGRIVGFFDLSQIVRGPFQNAYAGWRVSVDRVGRGLATEGVIGLLDLAFAPEPDGLGLHRVQANVIPENVASVRVAEKAGFRREGEARAYLRIAGAWRDHWLYAKLAEEHERRFLR